MSKKKGKPDAWSDFLWDAYKHYGEADVKYVQSCNRFLLEMLEQHLGETVDLTLKLMYVLVRNGDIAMPDHFDITTGLPSLLDVGDAEDEIDVYRDWYKEHIKWPEECLVRKETVEIGSMPHEVFSPWLLTACRELAIGAVQKNVSMEVDVYVSGESYEVDEPIPEDAEIIIKASKDVLE